MNYLDAIDILEAFTFDKRKVQSSQENKLIESTLEKIMPKIVKGHSLLKNYTYKNKVLRLNYNKMISGIYNQEDMRVQSEINRIVRNELKKNGINSKMTNGYYILTIENKKKNNDVTNQFI